MSEAILTVALWERACTGLDAVHKFAKLVQVLAASWEVLQRFLNRNQRKKLQVKKLREDLLIIGRELREAHFAIGEQYLLPPNDFLAQELAAVLMAVEKACAAEPRLYELEVVLERAAFVQERVADKLLAVLPTGTPRPVPMEAADFNDSPLHQVLADLSARSVMVAEALQNSSASLHASDDDVMMRSTASLASEDYDTAAEEEDELGGESCAESDDDGYTTCDEDAFWTEARSHLGVAPS